ncbi:hypothetical protein [Adonisia turfae]|nr:hypothetical protein [Adonisia turfae]
MSLLKIIEKDILTVEHGVLVHSVNCQGVMGAGLAKKIAEKWPAVKEDYQEDRVWADDGPTLGNWLCTEVTNELFIASIFGQRYYGRAAGRCYTSYLALALGFSAIQHANKYYEFHPVPLPIYIPHGIGCGLAGGDWHVVSALIEQELPNATICKLPT